jgi:hypothetical protein
MKRRLWLCAVVVAIVPLAWGCGGPPVPSAAEREKIQKEANFQMKMADDESESESGAKP